MEQMMSQQEVKRLQVMEQLKAKQIQQREAAQCLEISERQIRRLVKRYTQAGSAGLISKKRGRTSNRCLEPALCAKAIDLIGEHYSDFGPTLAQEKLQEREGIRLSVESTRQLMIKAGYWQPKRGRQIQSHPTRAPRKRYGEMIQIDGSPHDWFEGRSEVCTLLVFIDDATGKLTQLRFVKHETTLDYMHVLHDHIMAHGIPATLYSDKHSVFRVNAKEASTVSETQFTRAARELGIECIAAHSPQAKGRVERANQTLQDRLVKEMRLAGINDPASANGWISGFITDFNKRFAKVAKDATDAHLAYAGRTEELQQILSIQETRTLSKNLSCQYENQLLQIEFKGTGMGMRGAKIRVHEHFDGRTELLWRKRTLNYRVIDKPCRQSFLADAKTINRRVDQALVRRAHKPAKKHPWRGQFREGDPLRATPFASPPPETEIQQQQHHHRSSPPASI